MRKKHCLYKHSDIVSTEVCTAYSLFSFSVALCMGVTFAAKEKLLTARLYDTREYFRLIL